MPAAAGRNVLREKRLPACLLAAAGLSSNAAAAAAAAAAHQQLAKKVSHLGATPELLGAALGAAVHVPHHDAVGQVPGRKGSRKLPHLVAHLCIGGEQVCSARVLRMCGVWEVFIGSWGVLQGWIARGGLLGGHVADWTPAAWHQQPCSLLSRPTSTASCQLPAYHGGNLGEEVDDGHNRHEHCWEGKVVVGGGLKVEKRLGGGQADLQGSPGSRGKEAGQGDDSRRRVGKG